MCYPPRSPLQVLCERLQRNDKSLVVVDLSRKQIGDEELMLVAAALQGNHTVQKLLLGWNTFGSAGITSLCKALEQNNSVQKLMLRGNQMGNGGATSVAQMLKHNFTIKELYLSLNGIGNEGAKALAESLVENNNTLQYLSLSDNEIGNEGARAIGKMLRYNTGLKTLNMLGMSYGTRGKRALVEGVKQNVFLQNYLLDGMDLALKLEIHDYRLLKSKGRDGFLLKRKRLLPHALWAHWLAKLKKKPDLVYYFLQAKPELLRICDCVA